MIQDFIKKVGEFHDAFGVERGNVDVELRYKLFKEEFEEYKDAKTLVDKADAIIDMLYIACGTIVTHGYDFSDYEYQSEHWLSERNTIKSIKKVIKMYSNFDESNLENDVYIQMLLEWILDLANHNDILDKLPELFEEVQNSNMSKLDDNKQPIINTIDSEYYDPNKPIGKVLKSKNFFEPKLKEILFPK